MLPNYFDTMIAGGIVFDGTGAEGVRTDVGIVGERIAAVAELTHATCGRRIDAVGKAVCPGFIDIHTHSDISLLATRGLLSSLAQGVTSEVVGNCGFALALARDEDDFALERRALERLGIALSWSDTAGFLRQVEDGGIAINVATLAGHGTLRKRAMGLAARKATPGELAAMQRALADALESGAIGLSSGLEYIPGAYADVAELSALARVAAEAGGFYATHLRDEGDNLEESVAEAILVAETGGIALQLSHHKSEKPRNWGKVVATLALVDAASERGVDILLDQYPYTAYQTGLATIVLPTWAGAGSPAALGEQLRDPATRTRVRSETGIGLDWTRITLATCATHPTYPGHTVAALAEAAGKDPADWVLDLLSEGDAWVSAVHAAMCEEDVRRVLSDRRVMIGSDAVASDLAEGGGGDLIHPRTFGTFARILERYVRKESILTLPEAIRRMSGLPAQRLGWSERGVLRAGAVADIAVFSPEAVAERGTYEKPHALATGIDAVFVAGTLAFERGASTGSRTGKVLRRGF